MLIQIASDIHLDYRPSYKLEKLGDILILAGDIGQPFKANYIEFLKSLSEWKSVLLISGNHEYYSAGHTKNQIDEKISELCSSLPNVVYLNKGVYQLDNYVFLGTTLWTDIQNKPQVQTIMSDYSRIRVKKGQKKVKINPNDTMEWHRQELAWLLEQLEQYQEKQVLVITHHAPSYKSCQIYHTLKKEKNDSLPCVDDAYATSLEWICDRYTNLLFWFHGHVHQPLHYQLNQCQVICNPIGYPGQTFDSSQAVTTINL